MPPPPSSNSNIISLNSEDKTDVPPPGKPSPHPGHALLHTNDSDSSFLSGGPAPFNYFSPSSDNVGHRCSDVVSTPHTSQAEASTSTGGGKCHASSKHSCTSSAPTPTATTHIANITSKVHDLLLTGESFSWVQREEKGHCCDVHYHDCYARRTLEDVEDQTI